MKTTQTHYVYKITNNNPTDERKYYIGVRTSENENPQEDVKYMSSSESLKEAIGELGLENFSKEILSTWETREEANAEEVRMHWEIDVAANPEYYNKTNATSTKFDTTGKIPVIDTRDNSKKLVTIDELENNEFYRTFSKGNVNVIDTRDGNTKNVSMEDYRKYEFYQHTMNDKITAIDKRDGSKVSINRELFESSEYYISSNSKKINIYDNDGNIQFSTWGDFKKVCEEHNLPYFPLAQSSRKNGQPIPLSNSKKGRTRLINVGFGACIGWYAKEVK